MGLHGIGNCVWQMFYKGAHITMSLRKPSEWIFEGGSWLQKPSKKVTLTKFYYDNECEVKRMPFS